MATAPANDIVVHPTLKFVHFGYAAALFAIIGGFILQHEFWDTAPWWSPLVLCILLLWAATRHIKRLAMKLTVSPDKLRFETGILSKSTRTIQLGKVQDVRVDQSLKQRLVGVGTLAIETAGEASRLVIHDIDQPQALADEIMRRAESATAGMRGF
jgi:putative membrane protein